MKTKTNRWFLYSSGLLFGLFLLNVLLGKAALVFEMKLTFLLGDVGEFVILLAAVVCFVAEALRRESQEVANDTESAQTTEEKM